ncbi:MAG: cytidine deaminase [Bacteroidales bacterium]|nr:cytidine deaminase [Bacteroidales bacterium]
MDKTKTIHYQEYTLAELKGDDLKLVKAAIEATNNAYAPYSNFHVGAAVILDSGETVTGSNQENIAYPSGLCAERTVLFSAGAQHPTNKILALAVVGRNPEGGLTAATPCGACRQVMAEVESRQGKKLRILCYISTEKILVFEGVENLLPFIFTM